MDEQTINALCEKFHTTVDNLIPAYSNYMISRNIINIVIWIIILILGSLLVYIVHKKAAPDMLEWELSEIFMTIIGWAAIGLGVICILVNMYDLVLWLVSPEMTFFDVVVKP